MSTGSSNITLPDASDLEEPFIDIHPASSDNITGVDSAPDTAIMQARENCGYHHIPNLPMPLAASNSYSLGIPFLDSASCNALSGITPFICKLVKPTAHCHGLSHAYSITLMADNHSTPVKVQHILQAGFNKHIPLYHLTNKKMEEAAYTPTPPTMGLQITSQQLQLALVGLEKDGEQKLTSDLLLECLANLICSICKHLHAGADSHPGGPIANNIANASAAHFEHIRSATDFVSNCALY
ncbi:hypothetical protein H0H87_011641 [Tephrocybe sp. NHM501043]|nr:hypothetical protein H0H87_011641 [Tephrocybe sp. NHM501043]